jgi:hypothetical protein
MAARIFRELKSLSFIAVVAGVIQGVSGLEAMFHNFMPESVAKNVQPCSQQTRSADRPARQYLYDTAPRERSPIEVPTVFPYVE